MFRLRACADPTSRISHLGHIGTELERHRLWQANHDPDYTGAGCLFYHDCLDFIDKAAYDFAFQPGRDLEKDAQTLKMCAPVRMADGRARRLPHEYIPTGVQP
eukprot:8338330-Alexandrium_andersonii.AAC.1